jgi:hypothetical protein
MIVVVFLDKLYDEAAAYQQAKDEANHVLAVEKRNKKVRELFRQQTKANRTKVRCFSPLQFNLQCISRMNHGFLLNFSPNPFTIINSRPMNSMKNNMKMMIMIDN